MHPVSAIRIWEHGHHGTLHQEHAYTILHRIPEETLRRVAVMILAVGLMILMGLMITGDIHLGPRDMIRLFDSPAVPESPWSMVWKGIA
ncbi:MAG: hypothetical protein WCS52_12715 [bacterium]